MPAIVKVPVTKYVPLPDRLTKPCPTRHAQSRTVEAVVSAYNANVTALEKCNGQLDAIRAIQGADTEPKP